MSTRGRRRWSPARTRRLVARELGMVDGPPVDVVTRLRDSRAHAVLQQRAPWLVDKVPRDHWQTDAAFRRRRRVVAGTSVAGAALLGKSLTTEPGGSSFYAQTSAVAGVWVLGGLASGPLHLGRTFGDSGLERPVVTPLALGVGAFGLFFGAALVARQVPPLRRAVSKVLQYADAGSMPLVAGVTLANGAAEEVFFRGALYAGIGVRHPVLVSTGLYTLATVPTRNVALVIAAVPMGLLFGLQRRATGGILAPIITHVTWSTLMLRFLPPLFR